MAVLARLVSFLVLSIPFFCFGFVVAKCFGIFL